VVGRRSGRTITVDADCYAGPEAGSGVGTDIDTGAPPSIAAQFLHSGEIEARPGVWAPEALIPPPVLIRELERRGMTVTRRSAR
jgi:saccharopine dehydrogenase-like NADP-dependent oxidoreductase